MLAKSKKHFPFIVVFSSQQTRNLFFFIFPQFFWDYSWR